MWNVRKIGVAAACLVILIGGAALRLTAGEDDKRAEAAAEVDATPMTIAASCIGLFARGESWYLSVNSAGQAELTLPFTGRPAQRFQIPRQEWDAFRKALHKERFFELAGEYGERVADGSSQTLAVTVGDTTRSVRVLYLMNWIKSDPQKLREPSRAVRLLMQVRGWISDAEAMDLRPYDQRLLDAVPR